MTHPTASGSGPASYALALEALVKAVESHQSGGWPACPTCDEALVNARTALNGLRLTAAYRDIEDAERRALAPKPWEATSSDKAGAS